VLVPSVTNDMVVLRFPVVVIYFFRRCFPSRRHVCYNRRRP